MMDRFDHLRKILLLEPRGYPCQNVNFIFPPPPPTTTVDNNNTTSGSSGSSWQYVIGGQQKIYPLMSGHNTICVATALLECGVIPMDEPLSEFVLEAPAGRIQITARCEGGKAVSIAFTNAPSFVEHLDVPVVLPKKSGFVNMKVNVDVAYGGMWYCIVDLQQFRDEQQTADLLLLSKLRLDPSCGKELCRIGEMIKVACLEQYPVKHPTEDYHGCDILAFRDSGVASNTGSKKHKHINAVIMSNNALDWDRPETWTAMIDRSPCGTGTWARSETPLTTTALLDQSSAGRYLEKRHCRTGRQPSFRGSRDPPVLRNTRKSSSMATTIPFRRATRLPTSGSVVSLFRDCGCVMMSKVIPCHEIRGNRYTIVP
jgi:proline racemase